ncbi:hypothetical protein CVT25_010256 [Psilocybe cyanescens]|uniref:CxC2-like cysteine cluster KDZ transposase-associated domain-containing protein n=1 Tax=Psilocybe cyanescens TaxID=93625 RepID=A0A409XTR1_PSICY|nr:hypothetical protein CVT25_010256 [Psilocybe cyanescens]
MDLVACRLLPASFKKIRTLFSVQLMDHFRLCNLELKATAYQFYQLIRRMTTPIGRTEIVNRWLKKLRWAGYGHKAEDPCNPPAGSLSLYCPTCPQPGINLPTDWKDDPNRLVQYTSHKILFLTCYQYSTVYKRMFVTDGNFKADHVWQKYNNDIWLMDGSGMAPNKDDYLTFLESAIDRLTVCDVQGRYLADTIYLMAEFQKAPCENTFRAITNALLSTKACDRTGNGPDINSGTAAEMWLRLALLIEEKQIEIQDKVCRLGSAPWDQDQQIVMQLRQALTMMLAELKT